MNFWSKSRSEQNSGQKENFFMDMDFLRETIDGVLDQAVGAAHGLLETAQQVIAEFDTQLDEWAEELRNLADEPGGTQNKPLTPQEKYQYLIDAGSEKEKQLYSQEHVKSYLLNTPDVLDALFEMHSWDWSKKQ
jgi:hypothetical protein